MSAAALIIAADEFEEEEEYADAVASLTDALAACGEDTTLKARALEKRARLRLKLDQCEEAADDAAASLSVDPRRQGAWLCKGQAMFELEEFESALASFKSGKAVKGDAGKKAPVFDKWIRKCEAELAEEGEGEDEKDDDDGGAGAAAAAPSIATAQEETAAASAIPDAVSSHAAAPPRFRHDWYQTLDQVVVTIMAKNQDPDNVKVDITSRNLTVEIDLADSSGSSFILDLDLFDEIEPSLCKQKLNKFKLEVKLKKKEAYQWSALEAGEDDVARVVAARGSGAGASGSSSAVPSAYASGKDWNAIEQKLKKEEEEEKPEGEEALNKLFQQIYRNANEDTRRAMNKSFQTSGGTVLSTNWSEVGQKDYEKDRQAPEGMEWRNWEGDKLDKEGNPISKSKPTK